MAMVWPTGLDVDGYEAAGRDLEVPRFACPGCGKPLAFWGWYWRYVRVSSTDTRQLEVRRARCGACKAGHALLPGFLTWGRLDPVEVIGAAVEEMCGGTGMRKVADALGLQHTTVRDWRRRFRRRAAMLAMGLCGYVVALGDLAPRLSGDAEAVALGAARAAWRAATRRFGAGVGGLWRAVNAVVGGRLLVANMDTPFSVG